ncbi:MAG: hypothetical protein JWO82_2201 [Akkermansiaceae bacterium]|nr:hypothetical protein [Akkermansiaceae bacterium]
MPLGSATATIRIQEKEKVAPSLGGATISLAGTATRSAQAAVQNTGQPKVLKSELAK